MNDGLRLLPRNLRRLQSTGAHSLASVNARRQGRPIPLIAAPQRPLPDIDDLTSERFHVREIAWHGVVAEAKSNLCPYREQTTLVRRI
jgi:hypothetical protein